MAEGVEAVFLLGMPGVIRNYQRLVKKYLLALRKKNMVLVPNLFGIMLVPFKSGTFRQNIEFGHKVSI